MYRIPEEEGLLERGLLTVNESWRFGILKSKRYKLYRRTLTMVPVHGIDDLAGLLAAPDVGRTALLTEIQLQIDRALAKARHIRAKYIANLLVESVGLVGFFH